MSGAEQSGNSSPQFEIVNFLAATLVKTLEIGHEIQLSHQEEKRKTQELDHQAFQDHLTGLYNRRALEAFYERLRTEASRADSQHHRRANETSASSTLIVLDLDEFKAINDKRGHQMGDEILKRTARNMEQRARATDYVGRWGGEEFAIILPHADEAVGAKVAEDIRARIEQSGDVTASLGVLEVNTENLIKYSIEDMVALADIALYQAKERGRNQVVCYSESFQS